MGSNQAAYVDGIGQKIRVGSADVPTAKENEVVIRNHAVAINPLDWKQQEIGLFIEHWPAILGFDVAGEVCDVGADVADLKKGDRVIAQGATMMSQDPRHGGFQLYTAVPSERVSKIPDSTSYTEGVVLPVAFDSAVAALFGPAKNLGLPKPTLESQSSGKVVVVWGGSSSVGTIALQLLAASGVKAVATASPHNFEFCKRNGAGEVIDYKQESVVDDVVRAVKDIGGDFAGIFDTISDPDGSYKHVLEIMANLGGGRVITTLPGPENVPSNVETHQVHGEDSPLGQSLRKNYLGTALGMGRFRAEPETKIVGKGLKFVQVGLDLSKKGVSAKKVVIEL